VTSALAVLIRDQQLSNNDTGSEPSVTSFHFVVFTTWSTPSFNIMVAFSKTLAANTGPKEHANSDSRVSWGHQQSVHQEETWQEVKWEKNELETVVSETSVAFENIPVPNRLFAVTTEPIVPSDTEMVHHPKCKQNSGCIAESHISEQWVPPALSEVREAMFGWHFNDLVEQRPKVNYISVSKE
jgi:hypothetical protein